MGIPVTDINNEIISKLAAIGHFDRVSNHEPKSAPGNGLTAECWFNKLMPAPAASGLRSTSAILIWNIRLRTNMLSDPQDEIDPNLVQASQDVMEMFTSNFTLNVSQVRNVDLMGAHGTPFECEAGYVPQDNKNYRAFLITLPIVVNDCWEQVR